MIDDGAEVAARRLLRERPGLACFYLIWREYSADAMGYGEFHALAADPQECQAAVAALCAAQRAAWDAERAEIAELPEDERPHDPLIPDGCSAALCVVLGDGRYVVMQRQRWHNSGQTLPPAGAPDIFAAEHYRDKALRGAYRPGEVRS